MKKLQFLLFIVSIGTLLLSFKILSYQPIHKYQNHLDSLTLEYHKNEIKKEYVENFDLINSTQLDSIFSLDRRVFGKSIVSYSSDSSFKIFTIEVESCGAYCNSDWFSWIHYNLKDSEKIQKINFGIIDSIYKLPDHKYLIVSSNFGRPTSAYFVSCINADVISFPKNCLVTHPIKYKTETNFGFCQENSVESNLEPFIKYNSSKKKLTFQYGNNYLHSSGIDVDTIKQGYFIYIKHEFVLKKETIAVSPNLNK